MSLPIFFFDETGALCKIRTCDVVYQITGLVRSTSTVNRALVAGAGFEPTT